MDELIKRIIWLLQAVYVLMGLVVVFAGALIYFIYNPAAFIEEEPEQVIAEQPWQPRVPTDIPDGEKGELIRYGQELILNTARHIGPLAADENLKLAGNNLNCGNCHLEAGKKIGSGSFIGVANRFPQFSGRENAEGTLKDRINGCMERSMNGKVLAGDSREMEAMVAYMEWLSADVPEDVQKLYQGYMAITLPEVRADTATGRKLYELKCMVCHGKDGRGQAIPGEIFTGYVYPPLAGNDTYNDGAGMHRVITAAEFIKSNMPLGATYDAPQVTDEEAYHLAAYINSLYRPEKTGKENDFPDRTLKPVSTPYGPWADDYSPEQHKFGPFQPIMAYYKEKYGLTKNK